MAGRLSKLETAISKQRTVQVPLPDDDERRGRRADAQPVRALPGPGRLVRGRPGPDREDIRTFRVSRIRGEIRFATRRERDFRMPPEFDIDAYRDRPPWQIGDPVGEARIEVARRHRLVGRAHVRRRGRLEDGVFVTDYASLGQLVSWVLRQDGRAVPVAPTSCATPSTTRLRRVREAHEGDAPKLAAEADAAPADGGVERPAGPVAPERFGVLQALLAYLLAACGDEPRGDDPRARARRALPRSRPSSLEEHLSLLNLVNFGGGCYAVYAELRGDEVHVDKELFGDTFRAPPRLTPLEARAIRLALEFVGPTIAAAAHTPLDRVRRKLEETFGEFDLAQTPEPHAGAEGDLVGTLTEAIRGRRAGRDRVPEGGRADAVDAARRAVHDRARAAALVRPHVGPHARRRALVPARPDAQRAPHRRALRAARRSSIRGGCGRRSGRAIWYSPGVARWEVEKGARAAADGSAVSRAAGRRADWLVGEILSYRGEAGGARAGRAAERVAERARGARAATLAGRRACQPSARRGSVERERRAAAGRRTRPRAGRRAPRRSSGR